MVAAGKRPLEASVIPAQQRERMGRPASSDSVSSSTAAYPPGFASARMAMAEGGLKCSWAAPRWAYFLPHH
ncbi:hypothetical protein LINGRAHAP2_LOCUS14919 [Linum grandiflorum]